MDGFKGVSYYGGKVRLAPWIVSNFPKHEIYVDVFGGMANVLINKPKVKYEYYNDKEKLLVNFFSVLRDKKLYKDLNHLCENTEKSEHIIDEISKFYFNDFEIPSVKHAWAMWFIINNVWGSSVLNVKKGLQVDKPALMSPQRLDTLRKLKNRFATVLIWNRDVFNVLSLDSLNRSNVLFYLDPPYIGDQEGYRHKFDLNQHEEMLKLLSKTEAMFALSGFENDLYYKYAKDFNWNILKHKRIATMQNGPVIHDKKHEVTEILITNYNVNKTLPLFDLKEC